MSTKVVAQTIRRQPGPLSGVRAWGNHETYWFTEYQQTWFGGIKKATCSLERILSTRRDPVNRRLVIYNTKLRLCQPTPPHFCQTYG